MGTTYSAEAALAAGTSIGSSSHGTSRQAQSNTTDQDVHSGKKTKPPRAWREFSRHASRWQLKDIKRARSRFATTYEETGSFLISRRQFWEIFTDYDFAFVANGEFLTLPLEMFVHFEQEESGIADAREVFCLLVLLAQGTTMSERLEICFPLFGPSMTEERIAQFLFTLQRALFRLGILAKRASPPTVMSLAARICGEGAWRKCQTVSAQLLGDWLAACEDISDITNIILASDAHRSMQISLLRSSADIKTAGSVMKREAKKLVSAMNAPGAGSRAATRGNATRTAAGGRNKGSVVEQKHQKTVIGGDGRRPVGKLSAIAQNGAPPNETSSSSSGKAEGSTASLDGDVASRQRSQSAVTKTSLAGDGDDDFTTEDEEATVAISKFNPNDLRVLRGSWNKHKTSKKGLTKDQFSSVMHTQFSSITSPAVLTRMFCIFDRDHDGFLSFDEFIIGVSRLTSGSLEDKARFLFDVANAMSQHAAHQSSMKVKASRATTVSSDSDGSSAQGQPNLDPEKAEAAAAAAAALRSSQPDAEPSMRLVDLVKLVQDTNNELMECAHLVELIITMMDYDKNGTVERDEFYRAVAEIPMVLNSFDECLKPSEDLAVWTLKLRRAVPQLNLQNILSAWLRLGKSRGGAYQATWEQFVNFIEPIWEGSAFSPKARMTMRQDTNFDTAYRSFTEQSINSDGSSDELVYTILLNMFRVAIATCPAQGSENTLVIPGEEIVDLRKMLIGMVLSLERASNLDTESEAYQQAKGEFYFELFDSDGSEAVDYQEFFEFLYASHLSVQDAGWKAVELLRSLDINNDGVITFSEFTQAVRDNRDILFCFGRIFHASVLDDNDLPPNRSSSNDPEITRAISSDSTPEEGQEEQKASGESTQNAGPNKVASKGDDSKNANSNNNNEEEEEEEEDPDDPKRTLGQSASEPANLKKNKKPLLRLSVSQSSPALPLFNVYRTSYLFEKKVESHPQQPFASPDDPIFPASTRSKLSRKNTTLNSRRSPTNRDLKSPKSPGTSRSSFSQRSPKNSVSLDPL